MEMKRPNSQRNLDMAIRRLGADEKAFLSNRIIIANAIVGQLMAGAVVKGGSSLKMRFGNAATRATTDFDAARSVGEHEFEERFAKSLATGWEGFTGRLVELPKAHPKDVPEPYVMQPYVVKLSYLGRPWCTVDLELGYNELGDAEHADMVVPADANELLAAMGIPELRPIPLMALRYQIAQKLHGASEPGSQRAHDLVDLQIMVENGEIDLHSTRNTCVRLFSYRRMQAWPPVITRNNNWESIYSEAAEGLDVIQNIDDAIDWANDLIRQIEAS